MSATLAVIVPSLQRPESLARCLDALAAQHRAPDELLVVTRPGDDAVGIAQRHRARTIELDEPGVLAAMAAGVRASSAEVVCFTDDDATAPPEWTERLEALVWSGDRVGGAGGRDRVVYADGAEELARPGRVGQLSWYGRHHGHHHLGTGTTREVAFLKGVNCAYRRAALGLPVGLRGSGAQAHFEIAVGRHARAQGWRLLYDPTIVVEHRPAERLGEDLRGAPSRTAVADASYNLVASIGGARGLLRVGYATVLGDRGSPGLLYGAIAAARGDRATARRTAPAVRGTLEAAGDLLRGRALRFETFA